ncbi:MAG: 16S rRNA processing protein RimM [Deltaproteobacteria bacterium]|nr:16S rRNA processing protein RimM [Deltaproteobacteria bacterium]
MAETKYVAVAEIARPHGVTGELRLRVYNLDSDLLLGKPTLRLKLADGSTRPDRIRAIRRVPGAMLARLESVTSRDDAEALRGATLEVPRSALGAPAEGEVFHCDLEGCEVHLDGVVGRVARVLSYPTCDALEVLRPDGSRLEVPLTDAFVARIDVESGVVSLSALPD